MTSGTKFVDTRSPVDTGCGTSYPGRIIAKAWSGGDQPKVEKAVNPKIRTAYYWWDAKGNRVLKYRWSKMSAPPKRARSRGEHPYTMTLTDMNDPVMHWAFPGQGAQTGTMLSCFGTDGNVESYPDPWSAADDIKLILRLKDRIHGNDFDPSVFLAQSHQALGQIADAAIRIGKALHYVKRGNVAMAASALTGKKYMKPDRPGIRKRSSADALSRDWLGLQYGWLPLLEDAKNGAEFLAHQLNWPMKLTYRASVTAKSLAAKPSGYVDFYVNSLTMRKTIVARIQEEPNFWKLSGIANPANMAWEILPWSFVIDWFIPIGDYLNARGFAGQLSGTFITTTKRTRLLAEPSKGFYLSVMNSGYSRKLVNLERSISTSLDVPMPRFKNLGDVPSWKRAANAVALLAQHKITKAKKFAPTH